MPTGVYPRTKKVYPLIPCKCGCGELLSERDKYGFKRYWIKAHINKGKENRGSNNPGWKGGRYLDRYGYVGIKNLYHPRTSGNGYVKEHILVMEKHLGRYLERKEVVHHINGNRQDNRIENLMLFENQGKHLKHHLSSQRKPERMPDLCH